MSCYKNKILCLLLSVLLLSCSPQTSQHAEFYVFGTTVQIILPDLEQQRADQLFQEIHQQLRHMHQRWHAWEDSELTEINLACQNQATVELTPDTKELILFAQTYEQQSLGYFNPAIGGLIDTWGYLSDDHAEVRAAPTADKIDQALQAHPSMNDLIIKNNTLYCQNANLRLDFGGFAKGYALAKISDYLRAQGVNNALLNAGGDIHTLGQNGTQPWRVAVPLTTGSLVLQLANNESVFTSGSSERGLSEEHHHLINPKTGYPARTFSSVTVVSDDPTLADAAATALSVSKHEDWQQVADNMGITAVILQDKQGKMLITRKAKAYLD